MREVFYDKQYNLLLQKNGFIVVPLLDVDEVNFLLREHKKIEPKKEEPKAPVNPELGVIKDGYNKTFNKDGKIDREGEFKNAKLIDGKRYYYKDGKLEKTAIVRDGKVIRYDTGKEK